MGSSNRLRDERKNSELNLLIFEIDERDADDMRLRTADIIFGESTLRDKRLFERRVILLCGFFDIGELRFGHEPSIEKELFELFGINAHMLCALLYQFYKKENAPEGAFSFLLFLYYRISYVIVTDAAMRFSPGVSVGAIGAAPLSIAVSIFAYIG